MQEKPTEDRIQCSKCKQLKLPHSFHLRKSRKRGFVSRCKVCSGTPETKEVVRARARRHTREVRERVLIKYGHWCHCPGCSVTTYEFLAIDHIEGGGCKERREKKFANSQTFYSYLDKNYEPDKYQVLCHNCNSAKSFYGGCPLIGKVH